MRIQVSVFIAFLLLFCAILPVSGFEQEKPAAMIVDYTVAPQILNPDDLGTITVTIREIGTIRLSKDYSDEDLTFSNSTAWDDTVYIEKVSLEGNGLVVMSPRFDHIGQIGSDQALNLTFLFRAPHKTGIYYPEIWMQTDGGNSRLPFPVNVNTPIGIEKQAVIILSNSYPGTMKPGDVIPVRVSVRNNGTIPADESILTVEAGDSGLAPETTGKYYLGTIPPGSERTLDIRFLSDPELMSGLHEIPVTVRYVTLDGNVQTEESAIYVLTSGTADIGFVSANTTPQQVIAGQPFNIAIRIRNGGTGKATAVITAIDLQMAGTKQSYIGKIEPGRDAVATFMLERGNEGSYVYNATITYTDEAGTHTEVRQMALRVEPDPLAYYTIIALAVLAGAAGLLYYFRYLPRKGRGGGMP